LETTLTFFGSSAWLRIEDETTYQSWLEAFTNKLEGESLDAFKISETERMRLVHEYVLKHYKEKISLSAVAALANMTEAAFCRYFKTRANKTFSEFVREIRIGHACKLLLAGKMSIAQVGYESGFNTVSNFNSQFKAMKGKSPKQYQKIYVRD
jgi:AraC-like DNA-binding protein